MGYPRFQRARNFKFVNRTTGNITLSSTTWSAVDGAGGLDIVLMAQVGDVLEVGLSAVWNNEAISGYLDVGVLVAGSLVSYIGTAAVPGTGIEAWYGQPSATSAIGGSQMRALVAGDISSGVVTCRPYGRVNTSGSKTLLAAPSDPFHFWVKNLGPMDAT
jgi:hypothetical protein